MEGTPISPEASRIHRQLDVGRERLAAAALPRPRHEASVLLAHALGISRRELLRDEDRAVTGAQSRAFEELLARRASLEPLPYLLGSSEFYGLDIEVARGTMIPRPDTEVLVELALERIPEDERGFRVLDVGTGSGCVAAVLGELRPRASVFAMDVSRRALETAVRNACPRGVRLFQGSLLDAVGPETFDLVVGNPPYLDPGKTDGARMDLREQPAVAFHAAGGGLDCLRQLIAQAPRVLRPGGFLLVEHAFDQGARTRELATAAGLVEVLTMKDLTGHERCMEAQRDYPF